LAVYPLIFLKPREPFWPTHPHTDKEGREHEGFIKIKYLLRRKARGEGGLWDGNIKTTTASATES